MDFAIGEKKGIILLPTDEQIHIILKKQEEIDQLFAMLNYAPIVKALDMHNNDWYSLKKFLPRTSDYLKWHDTLCKQYRKD